MTATQRATHQRATHRSPRRRDDRGQAAGVETIPFGILVLLGGVVLVANVWAVVDTRAAVDAAARDYLRAYTAASTSAAGRDAGRRAARSSLAARERTGSVVITDPTAPFGPCRPATVRIEVDVPAVRLPFVRGFGTTTVTTMQTELVQPYGAALDESTGATPCD